MLLTVFAVRAFDAWRSPPLSLWHTEAPHELDADEIDAADWAAWLRAEASAFDEVRERVSDQLPEEDRIAANRYFTGSPMHASHFATDWNRSYVQAPEGRARGAVVLLHGLTDSPYSLRHIGDYYRAKGFAVVAIRLPGHGTVPAGLTRVRREDWSAATRLAIRHARSLASEGPLHVVGYSNGGALALEYALRSLDDDELPRADQLVLLSPMVGITSVARFAGVLGWPAVFPGFARAAWLDTLPEYNPYKYNSFPVNGARQSSQLVDSVQDGLLDRAEKNSLGAFPRVLAFQSVIDATVSSRAVLDVFGLLPPNGSELVLYDRNRAAEVGPLVRHTSTGLLDEFNPASTRNYSFTLVTGSGADAAISEAHSWPARGATRVVEPVGSNYPADMYSLSHVALPFPPDDALYGRQPRPGENYGVQLGNVAVRGERGTLVVGVETLMRAMYNPFLGYQLDRIGATLPATP